MYYVGFKYKSTLGISCRDGRHHRLNRRHRWSIDFGQQLALKRVKRIFGSSDIFLRNGHPYAIFPQDIRRPECKSRSRIRVQVSNVDEFRHQPRFFQRQTHGRAIFSRFTKGNSASPMSIYVNTCEYENMWI